MSRWERRDFVAQSYGQGRVLIAGDAAHECSPTGGIGMHTGLEEVVNLGWKLAAMMEGWGGPALVASYATERLPIARRNVELATRSFRAIAGIPGLARVDATDWRATPELAVDPGASQDPILLRGLADLHPGRHAGARPGAAALHAVDAAGRARPACLARGRPLHARPVRRRIYAAAARRAAARRRRPWSRPPRRAGVPLREIAIADPEIAALYERKLVLVRPDGHVAWRGDALPADPAGIVERMRGAAARAPAQERSSALAVEEQR